MLGFNIWFKICSRYWFSRTISLWEDKMSKESLYASKSILNLKIGLAINITFEDVFYVENLKLFIRYIFAKFWRNLKEKIIWNHHELSSCWCVHLWDCGSDPVTPLLSCPVAVLSQEQMPSLPHMHSFNGKDLPSSQSSLWPPSARPRGCV